jgi:hypothetical protein
MPVVFNFDKGLKMGSVDRNMLQITKPDEEHQ